MIDEEFKGDDWFLHAVYTTGNVFGSDQNQNVDSRMPAFPPVRFPEASFPSDLRNDPDDEYATNAGSQNDAEIVNCPDNLNDSNTKETFDGTPTPISTINPLQERGRKRRKIEDEKKESALTHWKWQKRPRTGITYLREVREEIDRQQRWMNFLIKKNWKQWRRAGLDAVLAFLPTL